MCSASQPRCAKAISLGDLISKIKLDGPRNNGYKSAKDQLYPAAAAAQRDLDAPNRTDQEWMGLLHDDKIQLNVFREHRASVARRATTSSVQVSARSTAAPAEHDK